MKIQKLSKHNLAEIIDLQSEVGRNLSDQSLYYPLLPEEAMDMLNNKGFSLGIFNLGNRLIAYAAVRFPGEDPDNLGIDSLEKGELARVAHIEAGLVHPDFRGLGLQKLLYREAINLTRQTGKFRYLYSTVACHNYPALANSLDLGLMIADLKIKYSGHLRYVLFQDWEQPVFVDRKAAIKVDSGDREQQKALLEDGCLGFKIEIYQTNILVHFSRLINFI
ncbi:MAG: GNAT family N-acetyltransferase [Syntrophomonadaceae bacterium]|nr:GNAT family N-acetyltransferase [Syntrophomonadaceae bacterium]